MTNSAVTEKHNHANREQQRDKLLRTTRMGSIQKHARKHEHGHLTKFDRTLFIVLKCFVVNNNNNNLFIYPHVVMYKEKR